MEFRTLKAEEIKARIDQVGEYENGNGYCTLLLYIDARTAQDILDETIGCEYWQNKHYEVKGNIYCGVGIKCNDEWVWKDDCGTESYAEAEKGESSDSFKRACVMWGLGRELYTAPNIRISCKVETNKKGKVVPVLSRFTVSDITIEDKIIKNVTILAYDKNSNSWQDYFFENGKIKTDNKKTTNTSKKETTTTKTLTLEEAKKQTIVIKEKIYSLGEMTSEQLLYLRDKAGLTDKDFLDKVSLVLMDMAQTGNLNGNQG